MQKHDMTIHDSVIRHVSKRHFCETTLTTAYNTTSRLYFYNNLGQASDTGSLLQHAHAPILLEHFGAPSKYRVGK